MKPISILCNTVLVEYINIILPMWKADISFNEKQILYECVKNAMCERLLLSYFILAENY